MEQLYLRNVVTLKLKVEDCTGCSMCTIVCPHDVFKVKNRKAEIVFKDYCMECGACAKNCPENAIYVKPGVGCAGGILMSMFKGSGSATCGCGIST